MTRRSFPNRLSSSVSFLLILAASISHAQTSQKYPLKLKVKDKEGDYRSILKVEDGWTIHVSYADRDYFEIPVQEQCPVDHKTCTCQLEDGYSETVPYQNFTDKLSNTSFSEQPWTNSSDEKATVVDGFVFCPMLNPVTKEICVLSGHCPYLVDWQKNTTCIHWNTVGNEKKKCAVEKMLADQWTPSCTANGTKIQKSECEQERKEKAFGTITTSDQLGCAVLKKFWIADLMNKKVKPTTEGLVIGAHNCPPRFKKYSVTCEMSPLEPSGKKTEIEAPCHTWTLDITDKMRGKTAKKIHCQLNDAKDRELAVWTYKNVEFALPTTPQPQTTTVAAPTTKDPAEPWCLCLLPWFLIIVIILVVIAIIFIVCAIICCMKARKQRKADQEKQDAMPVDEAEKDVPEEEMKKEEKKSEKLAAAPVPQKKEEKKEVGKPKSEKEKPATAPSVQVQPPVVEETQKDEEEESEGSSRSSLEATESSSTKKDEKGSSKIT